MHNASPSDLRPTWVWLVWITLFSILLHVLVHNFAISNMQIISHVVVRKNKQTKHATAHHDFFTTVYNEIRSVFTLRHNHFKPCWITLPRAQNACVHTNQVNWTWGSSVPVWKHCESQDAHGVLLYFITVLGKLLRSQYLPPTHTLLPLEEKSRHK